MQDNVNAGVVQEWFHCLSEAICRPGSRITVLKAILLQGSRLITNLIAWQDL